MIQDGQFHYYETKSEPSIRLACPSHILFSLLLNVVGWYRFISYTVENSSLKSDSSLHGSIPFFRRESSFWKSNPLMIVSKKWMGQGTCPLDPFA